VTRACWTTRQRSFLLAELDGKFQDTDGIMANDGTSSSNRIGKKKRRERPWSFR
jgi:hypothetical protein